MMVFNIGARFSLRLPITLPNVRLHTPNQQYSLVFHSTLIVTMRAPFAEMALLRMLNIRDVYRKRPLKISKINRSVRSCCLVGQLSNEYAYVCRLKISDKLGVILSHVCHLQKIHIVAAVVKGRKSGFLS